MLQLHHSVIITCSMAPSQKRCKAPTAKLRAVHYVCGPSLQHHKRRLRLAFAVHLRHTVSLGRYQVAYGFSALLALARGACRIRTRCQVHISEIKQKPEPAAPQPTDIQLNAASSQLEPGTSGRDADGERLLHAAQSGNTLAAKHLLTFTPSSKLPGLVSYSDPSTGLTPLAAASESGNAQLVKLLLKSGADCYGNDPDGVSPLMRACQKGHGDVVKVLLKEGEADAFAMTYKDGRTALMHAAAAGSVPCIQALLKIAHADIRQSSEQTGTHPLLEAALYGHFNAVKALLAAKAKANQTDKAGNTAVLLAARRGDARMVSALLAAGAKQFAEFVSKRTPLMEAACEGHMAVVQLLLAAGADTQARDTYGNTAVQLAGRPHVRALILAHATSMA